jgi:hypothetical protein
MKERPILFSAPMVRAILEGSKTQTRRIIKPKKGGEIVGVGGPGIAMEKLSDCEFSTVVSPFGQPGDRLWVRETWQGPLIDEELEDEFRQSPDFFKKPAFCAYRSTDTLDAINADGEELGWRPSIHIPRWASRINLEITGVRVERLQDISEEDACAEGVERMSAMQGCGLYRNYLDALTGYIRPDDSFSSLWKSINGPGSWGANPWVWVIEFKRAGRKEAA